MSQEALNHEQFPIPGLEPKPGGPVVTTKVVPGKVKGTYSISCSRCGYSGGNYADVQTARTIAEKHRTMPAPEHR
jgi:hypothetical protein